MNKSQKALRTQKRLFAAILVAVLLLALGFGYLLIGEKQYTPAAARPRSIDLPADKINPQEIWMNRVETENKLLNQKVDYLEKLILENKQKESSAQRDKLELKQEIAQLKSEIQTPTIQPECIDPFISPMSEPVVEVSFKPVVEFAMEEVPSKVKNISSAVPAGTSVKALLVSSIDANCGVYSINDPIPIKLRILDDGHLPKGVDVDLKGGIIIASAYGNLSSERVYMRLERMTQVNSDGDFVETAVAGYVTGQDGKYGVRGSVVDKSGRIIKNAAISGLLGEGSQILQSAVGRYRIDNYVSSNQAVNDPFIPGLGTGTSNAFDMLSDYYIKRAEQVEPVIQLNAGQIVDITFTHGVDIGELHTKDQIKEVRNQARRAND